MRVTNLTEGSTSFTSNVFLVQNGRNVLVDPGSDSGVIPRIRDEVESLDAIVVTHTHHDHIGELEDVKHEFGVEAWGYDPSFDGVDNPLKEGDTFRMDNGEFEVFHTPGHKNDHICLYGNGVLFSGDLIMPNGSFGRTDLEEGDSDLLIQSISKIHERVKGEEVREIHPGHGSSVRANANDHIELSLRNAKSFL